MFYRTWTVLRVTALWRDGTSGTASPAVLGSGVGARALSLLCSPATCYGACAITAPSSPRSVNYQWNRYIGMREYFKLFIYTGLLYGVCTVSYLDSCVCYRSVLPLRIQYSHCRHIAGPDLYRSGFWSESLRRRSPCRFPMIPTMPKIRQLKITIKTFFTSFDKNSETEIEK